MKFSKFRHLNLFIGLSNGNIADDQIIGDPPNSYAFLYGLDYCLLSGERHPFEWPTGAIKPTCEGKRHVLGCGILMEVKKKLSIFFTANGILMGQFPF